jgi:hypothetical protein
MDIVIKWDGIEYSVSKDISTGEKKVLIVPTEKSENTHAIVKITDLVKIIKKLDKIADLE